MPPVWSFLPGVTLAFRGLLWLHLNFMVVFSYLCEKGHWNFSKVCIGSVDHFA